MHVRRYKAFIQYVKDTILTNYVEKRLINLMKQKGNDLWKI